MSAIALTLLTLNTVIFSATTDYDELGRVIAERGNHGQNVRYAYDDEGRVKSITDSENRTTLLEYDPLGRLLKQVDANGKATLFAYDLGDRITSVTDPRGLVTTYEYDGFGQLWKQTSPDTGTTAFQYDTAGQRIQMTRHDGGVTDYTYDGLGRLTGIAADGQQQGYSYDWCSSGQGRLCGLASPGTATHFAYTPEGHVWIRRDWSTVNGENVEAAMTYGYDSIGRLSSIAYPDGTSADYAYRHGQLNAMSVNMNGVSHPIIANPRYQPFGQRRSFSYGNGLYRGYVHDLDGRLAAMSVRQSHETGAPLSYWDYGYTAHDQIRQIADAVNPDLTQDYGYDPLSRLTQVARYGVVNHLSYDHNGNHDRFAAGSDSTQYDIDPASNRVRGYTSTHQGSRQYQYDALGNRISETAGGNVSSPVKQTL
jgi:YD repeat-containing protein